MFTWKEATSVVSGQFLSPKPLKAIQFLVHNIFLIEWLLWSDFHYGIKNNHSNHCYTFHKAHLMYWHNVYLVKYGIHISVS